MATIYVQASSQSSLSDAVSVAEAIGDDTTIMISPGIYELSANLSPSKRISFIGNADSPPIIKSAGATHLIRYHTLAATGEVPITFSNLIFDGGDLAGSTRGIEFAQGVGNPAVENVIIKDCVFRKFAAPTVYAISIGTGNITGLQINNCTFEMAGGGIGFKIGTLCEVRNAIISNCVFDQPKFAIYLTGDAGGTEGFIIEDCQIINPNVSSGGIYGDFVGNIGPIIIRRNVITNPGTSYPGIYFWLPKTATYGQQYFSDIHIIDNEITGNYPIFITASGSEVTDIEINGNILDGGSTPDINIASFDGYYEPDSGLIDNIMMNGNNFIGTYGIGFRISGLSIIGNIDASGNWWQSNLGPSGPMQQTDPNSNGVGITGLVWDGSQYVDNNDPTVFGQDSNTWAGWVRRKIQVG